MNSVNRLFNLLIEQKDELSDHDLATLADWAARRRHTISKPEWKRAYSLLREGADLLNRQRALSQVNLGEKGELNHVDHSAKSIQV